LTLFMLAIAGPMARNVCPRSQIPGSGAVILCRSGGNDM
jgi:hypothetical protein